ncbi:MAG: TetR/AcrR family transcriptional regulator [Dysgonamonadaceae bacterium]|jgi:AcrR family transcriptional regulator|nr:TetR/AcrR family transcriptional regulator [Dysgonamonadaceae bacterium]
MARELKDRIVQAASTLFFNRGVKSMTMSDIANELGISKRTLYEVFRDKEELIATCVQTHLERVDQEIDTMVTNSQDVIDTLMRLYAKSLQNVQNTQKSVMHDLKKYHASIYRKIECRQKDGLLVFMPLFNQGIKQGLIRDDVNFEILTWLLKAQFKALMDDEYIPTDKYPIEEFMQVIILNFIRGIVTPLGNEKVNKIVSQLAKSKKQTGN